MDTASRQPDYDAIIVGGGISGITAAIRLQAELGLKKVVILEKNQSFGGTWAVNTYPGCGCDVPTRLYSLSFEQQKSWDHFYSTQPEIHSYLNNVAKKHNLDSKTLFGYIGTQADYDPDAAIWTVQARPSAEVTGEKSEAKPWVKTARILVSAMGALSVPRECGVPGAETFLGPLFHSAEWDHSAELKDKHVVIIGNGCSATQIVPQLASQVKQLTQIVRSKHWLSPFPSDLFKACRLLQKYLPGWIYLERVNLAWFMESHFLQADVKYGKGARARYAKICRRYIQQCAPQEYQDMLLPDEKELQVACKRRIFDAGYIPSLCRKNVELSNDQAVRITEHSVILQSGREIPADVIVHANGFKTEKYTLQMKINGMNGSLEEYWAARGVPQAYRGSMVSSFPNFFILWGPNTVTGHFSAIWSIESSAKMMCLVLRPIFAPESEAFASVQVSRAAEEKEQRYIVDRMMNKIYTTGCGSWYTDPDTGRVTALAPCLQHTFQKRCRNPVLSDLEYSGIQGSPNSYLPLATRFGIWMGRGDIPDPTTQSGLSKMVQSMKNAIGMTLMQTGSWLFDHVVPWDFPDPYSRE